MNKNLRRRAAPLLLAWLLAACGGGDGNHPDAIVTLGDWQRTRKAPNGATVTPSLTPAEAQEVAARSRDWAVSTMAASATLPLGNELVVPPLYFAFVDLMAQAAHGETLAQLRSVHPALPDAAVSAALSRGVQREATALDQALFRQGFLQAIELPSWRAATVSGWGDTGVKADTQLRVVDRFSASATLPPGVEFLGNWVRRVGDRGKLIMPMLRIDAGVRQVPGTVGFEAQALTLGTRRLVKITPEGNIEALSSAALSAAIDAVARATAVSSWPALPPATMVLPIAGIASAEERSMDLRGMAQAFDELRADLRGMNDGGNYAIGGWGLASLRWQTGSVQWEVSQELWFVHSPRNPYGGWMGVGVVNVNPFSAPCPTPNADLRPFYWLELDENHRVLLLARVIDLPGEACGNTIINPDFP